MFEKPPVAKEETKFEKLHVRKLVFAGLGVVTVASIFLTDEDGVSYLEKGASVLAESNVRDRMARLTPDERLSYDAISNILVEKVGYTKIGSIANLEQSAIDVAASRGAEPPQQPAISGFEQTHFLTNADIEKATSTTFFPAHWMDQVGSIKFQNTSPEISNGNVQGGRNTQGFEGEKDQIVINKINILGGNNAPERARYLTLSLVLKTLRHEVCHSNDWDTKAQRSFIDRASLLARVIGRVESSDAYQGQDYASDARGQLVPYQYSYGYQKRPERLSTYKEYFAVVCQAYLSDPGRLKEESVEDWRMIDNWIKEKDPTFSARRFPTGPFSAQYGTVLDEWKKLFD